jgi:hypothetical protein
MNLDMQLAIEVGGKDFKGNLREVVQINEAVLTDEFIKQPSLYAWFGALMEFASAEAETQKMNLNILRANLDAEKRSIFAAANKKATEAMVSAAIDVDESYIKGQTALIEADRQYGILKAIVRALDQRCTMLVQIGSTKRQEMAMTDFGINIDKVRKSNQ